MYTFQTKHSTGILLPRTEEENTVRRISANTICNISCGGHQVSFQLFSPESMEEIILNVTKLEGKCVFGETWKAFDQVDLQPYKRLLILAGAQHPLPVWLGV